MHPEQFWTSQDGQILTVKNKDDRSVTLTPALNANGGPVTITLFVSDGSLTTSTTFKVTITPAD